MKHGRYSLPLLPMIALVAIFVLPGGAFAQTCNSDEECETGGVCSIGSCVRNMCEFQPLSCEDDGDPCTNDFCSEDAGGCVNEPIPGCGNNGEGCLTRTGGFWSTHPHVAELFLPVMNCGLHVDTTEPETPVSTSEDLCIRNGEARSAGTSMQQLQLIRQCMAAVLNVEASNSNTGNCDGDYPGLNDLIADCCGTDLTQGLCNTGASAGQISASGCIDALDAFNNSGDTMDPFGPFLSPGPADPSSCRAAKKNKWVNPGRNLGPK